MSDGYRSGRSRPPAERVLDIGWASLFISVITIALSVAAIILATQPSSTNVSLAVTTHTLNFTGLGTSYFVVTATVYPLSSYCMLKIPAANATCTTNSSVATSTALTKLGVAPKRARSEPVTIYSAGTTAVGIITIGTDGAVTIKGTGLDFQAGVCGWSSDLSVSYLLD